MPETVLAALLAYLLGSIPTALLVSWQVAGVDIRQVGDGNMGARNVTRTLGLGPGVVVAAVDFLKGAMAVLLARGLGLGAEGQMLAGAAAVLGHDFPLFARFLGGQGMATMLGALFILEPREVALGLTAFGLAHLVTRQFDLSAAIGLGSLTLLVWHSGQPEAYLVYTTVLLLSIPVKKALDWPRRRGLAASGPPRSGERA